MSYELNHANHKGVTFDPVTGEMHVTAIHTAIEVTATRPLSDSDHAKVLRCNSATPIVLTLPATLKTDFSCTVLNVGGSTVEFEPGDGVVITPEAVVLDGSSADLAVATPLHAGSGVWYVIAGEDAAPKVKVVTLGSAHTAQPQDDGAVFEWSSGSLDLAAGLPDGWSARVVNASGEAIITRGTASALHGPDGDEAAYKVLGAWKDATVYKRAGDAFAVLGPVEPHVIVTDGGVVLTAQVPSVGVVFQPLGGSQITVSADHLAPTRGQAYGPYRHGNNWVVLLQNAAGTALQVFRSTDNGATWSAFGSPLGVTTAQFCAYRDGDTLWAATGGAAYAVIGNTQQIQLASFDLVAGTWGALSTGGPQGVVGGMTVRTNGDVAVAYGIEVDLAGTPSEQIGLNVYSTAGSAWGTQQVIADEGVEIKIQNAGSANDRDRLHVAYRNETVGANSCYYRVLNANDTITDRGVITGGHRVMSSGLFRAHGTEIIAPYRAFNRNQRIASRPESTATGGGYVPATVFDGGGVADIGDQPAVAVHDGVVYYFARHGDGTIKVQNDQGLGPTDVANWTAPQTFIATTGVVSLATGSA